MESPTTARHGVECGAFVWIKVGIEVVIGRRRHFTQCSPKLGTKWNHWERKWATATATYVTTQQMQVSNEALTSFMALGLSPCQSNRNKWQAPKICRWGLTGFVCREALHPIGGTAWIYDVRTWNLILRYTLWYTM